MAIHSNQRYKAAAQPQDGDKWACDERGCRVATRAQTHGARAGEGGAFGDETLRQLHAREVGRRNETDRRTDTPTAEGRGQREG